MIIMLHLLKQEMLAFQTSGGVEVKKYVIHFMEVAWYVTLLSACSGNLIFVKSKVKRLPTSLPYLTLPEGRVAWLCSG